MLKNEVVKYDFFFCCMICVIVKYVFELLYNNIILLGYVYKNYNLERVFIILWF